MDEFITVKEVARRLSVAPWTIRAWAREGKLPAHKLGRDWRFKWAEVEPVVQQTQPRQ